ncbi:MULTISPECIES: hypothetical protein [Corallococcus]|uniref:hypothetical protein n=1 Tax=Corallococcus TaxID=83461 RepID=UPI0013151066|nr:MULTISPECIES: hypothetical protein [Corallococcus]
MTWWKQVTLVGGGDNFSKARLFGVHTDMYTLGNLGDPLTGGDRVTFRWIHD